MRRSVVVALAAAAAAAGLLLAPGAGPSTLDTYGKKGENNGNGPPASTPGSGVACNVQQADVGYTAAFDHGDDRFEVTEAHVHVSPSACAGSTLTVKFTDEHGGEIGSGSAQIQTADVTVAMTVQPAAELVTGVNIAIEAGRGNNPPQGGASGR